MLIYQFDDLKTSTMTVIVEGNVIISLDEFYKYLNPTVHDINKQKNGHIIYAHYFETKGKHIKKDPNTTYFTSSISIIMYVYNYFTLKITSNGTLHFTGCTSVKQVELATAILISFMDKYNLCITCHRNDDGTYNMRAGDIIFTFRYVMMNRVFHSDCHIDRKKLNTFINCKTPYKSVFDPEMGYPGVNIKFHIDDDEFYSHPMPILKYSQGKFQKSGILRAMYVNVLTKEANNYKTDTTFLVFYSGSVIMIGPTPVICELQYYRFKQIINDNENDIKGI